MSEVFDEIWEDGKREGIGIGKRLGEEHGKEGTMLNNLHSIMEELKYSTQQAMDLLEIPVEERSKYLAKL